MPRYHLLLLILSCQLLMACNDDNDLLAKMLERDIEATDLHLLCDQDQQRLKKQLAVLEAIPASSQTGHSDSIDYLNQLDDFFIQLDNSYSAMQLLSNTHPNGELRSAASDCQKKISNLNTDVSLSNAIYEQLNIINLATDDKDAVRFQKKLLQSYVRSGVNQPAETRKIIRQLQNDIAELGQLFSKNIRDDVRHIAIQSADDLKGLPQDYIDKLDRNEQGQQLITTDYPSVFPFLRYAHSDQHRHAIYLQFLNRGYPNNEAVLEAIITKRHQLATSLGYKSYAAYATETAMIENPENAAEFINKVNLLATPRAERDYAQLLAQLQQTQAKASTVGNWQKSFLEQQVKKQHYQFDSKAIRQYFPYQQVKNGVFDLVGELFELKIVEWQTPVWDSSVTAHQLQTQQGETLGYFYLDMHPREGKYKHAAHFGIQTGVANKQLPISALICNFPGADQSLNEAGQVNDLGLMEHSQVETFLHEFGHLLHSLIGGHQSWSGLSGIATERDFVEAPSQLLEQWVWDYDSLQRFAINADGEAIPKPLVDKMIAARDFGVGTHIRNQMFYAALSLNYYSIAPKSLDLKQTLMQLQSQYSPFDYMEDTHFYANFGHLFGYSARYYTYMWSEVIAADLFSEFEQQGLMNKTLAKRYRDQVLAPGGSQDAAKLVETFLGRPFNYQAFNEQLNAE
ncbi:MAG: tetraacyldisaccharide 4'-kinase [Cellvibrionales bacterium]|nr:tetraacyldisaccharide 4'-kinase [Cellvibrionales bacterium]